MPYTFRPCAAPQCTSLARKWSALCAKHTHKALRYGAPDALPVNDSDLHSYELTATAGLIRYVDRSATHAAIKLASDVLAYQALHGFGFELATQHAVEALRDAGVTAQAVLTRTIAFIGYTRARPQRFMKHNAETQGLARAVLRLSPGGIGRPPAKFLRHFGGELLETLGPFANALLSRLESDAQARASLVKRSTDFDTTTNDNEGNTP